MLYKIVHKLKWFYKEYRLSHFLPFTVLITYTLIGAAMFRHFELEPDEIRRRNYRESTEYAFNQIIKRMAEIQCGKGNGSSYHRHIQTRETKEALFWLIDYLNITNVIEERCDTSPWTWMGSLFYAGQLYTTIGYGLPAAQSTGGRVATIFYIMVGIPIFLIILKDVGKILSRTLRKIYKRMRSAKQKLPDSARRMSEPVKAIYNLSINPLGGFVTHDTGDDLEANRPPGILKKPTDQESIEEPAYKKSGEYPIPLALTILALWIALSAAMFCLWEHEWGYLTSVYFFFVSISTVGLGDVVPTKPDMMLVNFFLILIGLALLSMCINLIQDYIEKLIEQILEQYIEEIEKMAQIVTNTDDMQQEEAKPFEVGMTDMLTVPLTTITEHPYQNSFVRSAKDWVAEKIVGNVLMNRLDPHHSSSDSSEDEVDDETRKISASTQQTREDTVSRASVKSHKKPKRALQRNAMFGYNLPTLRAIQAIETVKMRTDIHGDFKSRMFAKFATNSRWNKIVDTQPTPAPTKMVSFSVQTSPIQERDRRRPNRTDFGVGLGSMDSFSSNSRRNGPDSSTRSFDVDSLCSSAYNDVVFGPYTTDSIPLFPTDKNNLPVSPSSPVTILLNRSSNSPIGSSDIPMKLPQRRYSTSNCLECPSTGRPPSPHSQMPFRRCPSCYENFNRDESKEEERTMKRIRELCGILPGDFLKQGKAKTNDDSLNHQSNLRDLKRSSHLSPT